MSTFLADEIAAALTTAGVVGGTSGWEVQRWHLQDTPDQVVVIYETGGDVPEERYALDRPGFQIRVRGLADDFRTPRQKLADVFNALHTGEVAIGTSYVFVYGVQSGPIPMGMDEKRRPSFVINFRTMKARTL